MNLICVLNEDVDRGGGAVGESVGQASGKLVFRIQTTTYLTRITGSDRSTA